MKKYKLFDTGNGGVSKWLTLHNAIAVSYYVFNALSALDKCLKNGVIPLPSDMENEEVAENGDN